VFFVVAGVLFLLTGRCVRLSLRGALIQLITLGAAVLLGGRRPAG
jgi:hypothetical protein